MNQRDETIATQEPTILPWVASAAGLVLMVLVLWGQGRIWWCKFSDIAIYVHEAWGSSHTSQHLLDPYTFTHILHGVAFAWLTGLIFSKLSIRWRVFIAILAEAGWEVLENSNYIIEKYRENTASLEYFGDSITNSVGDVFACAAGFWIAHTVGWLRSFVFFVVVELLLLLWIRDSLLLNIVMLLCPLDGVKQWQMNGF